jgi:hypothetical protein
VGCANTGELSQIDRPNDMDIANACNVVNITYRPELFAIVIILDTIASGNNNNNNILSNKAKLSR